MITTQSKAQSYIIKRPRLTKLLDESEARIILLCAPAGYGKTTLAREWVETLSTPVAWCSAGPTSDDIAAITLALAAAAQSVCPKDDLLARLSALAANGQSPARLAHELARSTSPGTVFVVDDYQQLIPSPESQAVVELLASQLDGRMVITSRARPYWVEARSEIYGESLVLGADQLAFTDDEAIGVLGRSDRGDSQAILSQSQGWPAVIALAARHKDSDDKLSDLLPAQLYEFFATDLFRSAPRRVQHALLAFAIGADAHLSSLAKYFGTELDELVNESVDRGFVTRRTDASLELHPLLRAFLRARIRELPEGEQRHLLDGVLEGLVAESRWDDCLATLEAFPDESWMVRTLEDALPTLLAGGRVTTVRRWLLLSHRLKASDPVVLLAEAEVLMREGRDAEAQRLAEHAAQALGANADRAARAHMVAARAAHMRNDSDALDPNAQLAFELAVTPQSRFEAVWLAWLQAFERQSRKSSEELFGRLCAIAPKSPEAALRVAQAKGMTDFENGRIHAAVQEWEQASALLPHVRDPLLKSSFLNQFSHAALAHALYSKALELAHVQVEEANTSGLEFVIDHGLLVKAGALIGLRELRQARDVLDEIGRRDGSTNSYIELSIGLMTAKLRIASQDLERALDCLGRALPANIPRSATGEFLAYRGLAQAALGDVRAIESLDAALAASSYVETVTVAKLARTVLAMQTGRSTDGHVADTIRAVILTGHHEAIVTALRAYPRLAQSYAAGISESGELRVILERSRDWDLARNANIVIPRKLRRGDDLSPREREVCELIMLGRTNAEISKALFISESTTKVHVRHIFEKLGAHSRAEAVAILVGKRR